MAENESLELMLDLLTKAYNMAKESKYIKSMSITPDKSG